MVFSFLVFAQNSDLKLKAFTNSIQDESLENYEKAIEGLTSVYAELKTDYLTNLRLGWLYYSTKDYETSLKYYREAVRISGRSTEALLGLTYPYSGLEMWEEIKVIYEEILEKDKYNYTANLRLGQIFLNTTNYSNAKVYLEKNINNYPSDYETNLYLGWTYYYLGNKSKARELFVNALISKPNDASALEGLKYTK